MFTKNWYAISGRGLLFSSSDTIYGDKSILPYLTDVSGNSIPGDRSDYNSNYERKHSMIAYGPHHAATIFKSSELYSDTNYRTSSVSPGYGVYFASGTEAENLNSYAPGGDIFTTFTASYSREMSYDELGMTYTYNYTLTNTGDTDFTIGEVGLLGYVIEDFLYSYTHYYFYHHILLERTVLETPITIPAGGVGQVTYTIRMNYPTA